jgi:hypothetical protein
MNLTLRDRGIDVTISGKRHSSAGVTVNFIGTNPNVALSASSPDKGQSNYLIGSDPSRWRTHIPTYRRVTYSAIYPGIDLTFYGNGENLEHDFVVDPGTDYRAIRMDMGSSSNVTLGDNGDLKISAGSGEVIFQKPTIYQIEGNRRQYRNGRFALRSTHEAGFEIEDYDPSKLLVIDPILSYSTYLADTFVHFSGIAADASGNTYLTGLSFSGTYPVTPGSFQQNCASCATNPDIFITKLNADGSGLAYSTYLGGSDYDEALGIAIDANGNVILGGRTSSVDFPVKNQAAGTFSPRLNPAGFITSLSPDGSTLNYSSLVAFEASRVAVDPARNAYIAGGAGVSYDVSLIPVTAGALDNISGAGPFGGLYVMKFSSAGALGYSAVVGSGGPQGIAADASGNVYITGTGNTPWPTTSGAFQTSILGSNASAIFVAKISSDGSRILYSTFLGGDGQSNGIVLDGNGNAFVAGYFVSSSYPTTANAYQKASGTSASCCFAFLTEVNQDGSKLVYSTLYGNVQTPPFQTTINSLARDSRGNIWLAGRTSDLQQFPLVQPLQFFPGFNGNDPFAWFAGFVSRFDPIANKPTFSTFFGDPLLQTNILGIDVDGSGKAHVSGYASSGLYTNPAAYLHLPASFPSNTYGFAAEIDADAPAPALCISGSNRQMVQFPQTSVGYRLVTNVTVVNCGTLPLTISSAQSSSPFFTLPSGLQSCGQPIAANSTCTFLASFAPATATSYSAVLTFTSNASIAQALLPLVGTGVGTLSVSSTDFQFSPAYPGSTTGFTTATVNSGQSASYLLGLQAGTAYTGNVSLTCAQVPSNYRCTIAPASAIPLSPGNNVSFVVTVATTATSALTHFPGLHLQIIGGVWVGFASLILVSLIFFPKIRVLRLAILIFLFASIAGMNSCGGSSNSNGGSSAPTSQTFTLNINASDGTTSHTQPITLTVQ